MTPNEQSYASLSENDPRGDFPGDAKEDRVLFLPNSNFEKEA